MVRACGMTDGGPCDHVVRPVPAAGAREHFRSSGQDAGADLTELLTTRFYVTDGRLSGAERSDPNRGLEGFGREAFHLLDVDEEVGEALGLKPRQEPFR